MRIPPNTKKSEKVKKKSEKRLTNVENVKSIKNGTNTKVVKGALKTATEAGDWCLYLFLC